MVKKKDLWNMDAAGLEKQQKELNMELMKLNSQRASGTVPKNPGQIKNARKTIARILTILSRKSKEKTNEEAKKK
jgi:large subunit ribosomal protein L29